MLAWPPIAVVLGVLVPRLQVRRGTLSPEDAASFSRFVLLASIPIVLLAAVATALSATGHM
jgi:hypothetical protein